VIDDSTIEGLLFPEICPKPVVAQLDQRQGSSDGWAPAAGGCRPPLRIDRLLGLLSSGLAAARKIGHSLEKLLGQRVFAVACGCPDANDAARRSSDPIHELTKEALADSRSKSRLTSAVYEKPKSERVVGFSNASGTEHRADCQARGGKIGGILVRSWRQGRPTRLSGQHC